MRAILIRATVAVVLCLLLGGMIMHYAITAPSHDQVQRSVVLLESPSQNTGKTVYFWATVIHSSNDEVLVEVSSSRFTLLNVEATLAQGDVVQVYGKIRSEHEIVVRNTIVSKSHSLTRMLIISVGGFLLTARLFVRSWRLRPRKVAIEPRKEHNA